MLTILFYLVVGYAVCVLFPIPPLTKAVLAFWALVGSKVSSLVHGTTTPVATTTTTPTDTTTTN